MLVALPQVQQACLNTSFQRAMAALLCAPRGIEMPCEGTGPVTGGGGLCAVG